MSTGPTAFELEVSRIRKSYGPRYLARMGAIDAERGWDATTENPERGAVAAQIDAEETERIAQEIAAIPDEVLSAREMLPRRRDRLNSEYRQLAEQALALSPEADYDAHVECRCLSARMKAIADELDEIHREEEEAAHNERLDAAESLLCGEGATIEDLSDAAMATLPLRAVFLGMSPATLRAIEERSMARKAANA